MRSSLLVILLMLVLGLQVFSEPRGVLAASGMWTQSTQADFQSGTMNNVVYNATAHGLILAAGGHIATMGFPAVNGTDTRAGLSGITGISAGSGGGAPVSGLIVGYAFFLKSVSASPAIKIKVLRDNGTHYLFVTQSAATTSFIVGRNHVDLTLSPVPVNKGDLLGFYWANIALAGDSAYCPTPVRSGDITATSTKSSWFTDYCTHMAVEAEILPTVSGSLVSSAKDLGGFSTWGAITWHASLPTSGDPGTFQPPVGTSVSLQTRTSNDSATWTPWFLAVNNTLVPSPPARYIQYWATLGGNGTLTPILRDVTINFNTIAPAWPADSTLAAAAINRTTVLLAWSPATGNLPPTYYRIYQGSSLLATLPGSQYAYIVSGLTAGSSYTFTVQAGDAANDWSTTGPSRTIATPNVSATILEPSTILSLTILIAAAATLAVASTRARKPPQANIP